MKNVKNVRKVSRLTSALLAKKGTAAPSPTSLFLNQQALNRFSSTENESGLTGDDKSTTAAKNNIDSVGNKPVVSGDENILTEKNRRTDSPVAEKRIAMTLRMEREDHLKLRLFSAYTRKSCQAILSEALDRYLIDNSNEDYRAKIASHSR